MQNIPEPYRTLFEAVTSDNGPEAVRRLVKEGADLAYTDPNNGRTLLYAAVRADRVRAAEALLRHGANPNQLFAHRSQVDGRIDADRIALHYVTSVPMTELLLRAGSNVNAPDAAGTTPLMCASFHGLVPVLQTLLAAGASATARQNDPSPRRGHTAREMAEAKIAYFQNAGRNENRETAYERRLCYEKIRDLLLRAETIGTGGK